MNKNDNFQEIQQQIEKNKKIPKEYAEKINLNIFTNIIIAIFIVLYWYFINLGSLNIETNIYIIDLKVFSVIFGITSVILFEISYKKDSGKMCIYGIEMLIVGLITLFLINGYYLFYANYNFIIAIISFIFAVYYLIKSFIIYKKMKKQYFKEKNDIKDIVKKEGRK